MMYNNLMNNEQFTAVLDSGVGGISVLASARRMMAEENFVFFADAANSPYGDRQTEEIRSLMLSNCEMLMSRFPLKAIVIACNTATSAAAAALRQTLPIPVLGVEPAIKPASEACAGPILVLATSLTIREEKFRNLLTALEEKAEFFPQPCPGLMELIEADPEGPDTEAYLRRVIENSPKEPRAIVLGCTHYVFLRPMIRRLYPQMLIFDGNEGVSRHLNHILSESGTAGGSGRIEWLTSSTDAGYPEKCRRLFSFAQRKGL